MALSSEDANGDFAVGRRRRKANTNTDFWLSSEEFTSPPKKVVDRRCQAPGTEAVGRSLIVRRRDLLVRSAGVSLPLAEYFGLSRSKSLTLGRASPEVPPKRHHRFCSAVG